LTDKIMQAILKDNEFEVPKRLVDFEVQQMIKQTEEQLERSGMNLEAAGLSREMLAQSNEPVAIQRVRGDFILKKIAQTEDLKLKDEDMDRGFKRIGDQYNMSVAQVKEFFSSRDDLLPLMNELLNEKVLQFLRDGVKFVEPQAAPVEEEKTTEES
jgi:trigger factor